MNFLVGSDSFLDQKLETDKNNDDLYLLSGNTLSNNEKSRKQ
jgi:hypothetical protein